MTAVLILIINMVVAGLFAVAFAVVAATNPTTRGARWLAVAYGLGIVDVLLEFLLPWLANPTAAVIGIFLVYLAALTCGLVGVALHYRLELPRTAIGAIWLVALSVIPIMLSLPYGTGTRLVLYQLPYAAMQALMLALIVRAGRKTRLDRLLIFASGLATLFYLVKPLVAVVYGAARSPQDYLSSQYAAISQTMGSVILIALALVLLLIMMRDMTIEMVSRSETDPLSGALNRRGFQTHAEPMLAVASQSKTPLTLVIIDVDRFKTINDTFGHLMGDLIIADLASLLEASVEEGDLVARLEGDQFALLLAGQNLKESYELAEAIRKTISTRLPARLGNSKSVTASFGVAELQLPGQLSDLMRRCHLALYRAKAQGRNQVSITSVELGAQAAGEVSSRHRTAA